MSHTHRHTVTCRHTHSLPLLSSCPANRESPWARFLITHGNFDSGHLEEGQPSRQPWGSPGWLSQMLKRAGKEMGRKGRHRGGWEEELNGRGTRSGVPPPACLRPPCRAQGTLLLSGQLQLVTHLRAGLGGVRDKSRTSRGIFS